MNPALSAGLKRFCKGFISGGIAQVLAIIGPGLSFHSLADVQSIVSSLAFGFLVGGLLAAEKMYQFIPTDGQN